MSKSDLQVLFYLTKKYLKMNLIGILEFTENGFVEEEDPFDEAFDQLAKESISKTLVTSDL